MHSSALTCSHLVTFCYGIFVFYWLYILRVSSHQFHKILWETLYSLYLYTCYYSSKFLTQSFQAFYSFCSCSLKNWHVCFMLFYTILRSVVSFFIHLFIHSLCLSLSTHLYLLLVDLSATADSKTGKAKPSKSKPSSTVSVNDISEGKSSKQ